MVIDNKIIDFKNNVGWYKFVYMLEILECLSLLDNESSILNLFALCSGNDCWKAVVGYSSCASFKCNDCL